MEMTPPPFIRLIKKQTFFFGMTSLSPIRAPAVLKKTPILLGTSEYINVDSSKYLQLTNFTAKTTPAGQVREIFAKEGCRRKAINDAFSLSNVHSKNILLVFGV